MSHVKLNLSCPRALGEQLVEYLLDRLEGGFTTLHGHGHGGDFSGASLAEKVRGHVDVLLVMAILPAADVAPLMAEIKTRFPSPQLVYWTEPVADFGDCA
jgi:hypothetical protein